MPYAPCPMTRLCFNVRDLPSPVGDQGERVTLVPRYRFANATTNRRYRQPRPWTHRTALALQCPMPYAQCPMPYYFSNHRAASLAW
jgi:hypothetical protein